MLLQLQDDQISLFWDEIKRTVSLTCGVRSSYREEYFTALLQGLLLGKYQAWVIKTPADEIVGIGISKMQKNELSGRKSLHVVHIYGYRRITQDIIESDWIKFVEFAKRQECEEITFSTNVERIKELCGLVGFKLVHSNYCLEV